MLTARRIIVIAIVCQFAFVHDVSSQTALEVELSLEEQFDKLLIPDLYDLDELQSKLKQTGSDGLALLVDRLYNPQYVEQYPRIVGALGLYEEDARDHVSYLIGFIINNQNKDLSEAEYLALRIAYSALGKIGGDVAKDFLKASFELTFWDDNVIPERKEFRKADDSSSELKIREDYSIELIRGSIISGLAYYSDENEISDTTQLFRSYLFKEKNSRVKKNILFNLSMFYQFGNIKDYYKFDRSLNK